MAINFENVNLLGISQTRNKFDSDITFSTTKSITISGNLIDLQNSEGVEKIFKEASDLIKIPDSSANNDASITNDIQEVFINGVSQGEGKIENFSIDGDQIQTAQYQATILINEAKNLQGAFNLTQNKSSNLSFSSDWEGESDDLKYLESFSENFSFDYVDNQELSMSHSIDCAFGFKPSIIPKRNNIFSNASIQGSKLINLSNKGKGAIKVGANRTATFGLQLQRKNNGVAQEFVLSFDYLGQNSTIPGSCSVSIAGQTITLQDNPGRKEIAFSVSVANLTTAISLTAASSVDTFFDNFELHKRENLPIEKARLFSKYILDRPPNYPIIQNSFQGKYQLAKDFHNLETEESFDEINLTYSASRKTTINSIDFNNEFSLDRVFSFNHDSNGVIEIEEKSIIKSLKNASDEKIRSYANSLKSGAYSRCLEKFRNYKTYFNGNCSTPIPTPTPLNEDFLSKEPISIGEDFDSRSKQLQLSIKFTNDKTHKFIPTTITSTQEIYKKYNISTNNDIEYLDGFHELLISGSVSGAGKTVNERNQNANDGFNDFLSSLNSIINEVKSRNSISENFNLVDVSRNLDINIGSISFNVKLSTNESFSTYEKDGKKIAKSFFVKIENNDATRIYNEFFVSCENIAQFLNASFNPKAKKVSIQLEGYREATESELLDASKDILTNKGLLIGSSSDDYLVKENFQFTSKERNFTYERNSIDVSECIVPTVTQTVGFGWNIQASTLVPETPTYYKNECFQLESCQDGSIINYIPKNQGRSYSTPAPYVSGNYYSWYGTRTYYDSNEERYYEIVDPYPDRCGQIKDSSASVCYDDLSSYFRVEEISNCSACEVEPTSTYTFTPERVPYTPYIPNYPVPQVTPTPVTQKASSGYNPPTPVTQLPPDFDGECLCAKRCGDSQCYGMRGYALSSYKDKIFYESSTKAFCFELKSSTGCNYYLPVDGFVEVSSCTHQECKYTPPPTPTNTGTPGEGTYFHEIFIPENWNNTIANLWPQATARRMKRCLDYFGSNFNDYTESLISPQYAEQTIVRDCIRNGNGEMAYSIIFEAKDSITPPTPSVVETCSFYMYNVPDFWENSVQDLSPGATFIGGYRGQGSFSYQHQDNANAASYLIKPVENNTSHPNFSEAKELYVGPLLFKNCATPTPPKINQIFDVSISCGSTDTVGDLIPSGYNQNNIEIIGYSNCFNEKRFNEPVVPTLPPTATQTGTVFNYEFDEDLDCCDEESTTNPEKNRDNKIETIHFKEK